MMLPQSLLRQSYVTSNKPFSFYEFDIKIEFNSRVQFYYNTFNSSEPIKHNELDFELIAAHELSHGLGFTTSLTDYNSYGKDLPAFIGPKIYLAPNGVNLMPSSALDYMMYGGNYARSFGDMSNEMFDIGCDITTDISCAKSVVSQNSMGYAMYHLLTRGKIELVTKDDTKLQLSTDTNEFIPGQTLVHLHQSFDNTLEFLMTPFPASGETLETKLHKFDSNSLYGPKTLKVFEGIGYNTKATRQEIRLYHE